MSRSHTWAHRGEVHYQEHAGPPDGPTFVLVHGLGGHHRNWMRLAPLLATRGRVLALDYRGFGYTPLAGNRSTLEHNEELITSFIKEIAGEAVVLVGNSTGGLLSIRTAAGSPHLVRGVVLVDPALPGGASGVEMKVAAGFAALLVPRLGEEVTARRAARKGLEAVARETMELCTVDPDGVPADVIEAHLAMAREREEMPWTQQAFLQLARSLLRSLLRPRAYRRTVLDVTAPTLHLHGVQDRLVPIARARALHLLRPDWPLVEFPHLGHAPMFEDPDALFAVIEPWLDDLAPVPATRSDAEPDTDERAAEPGRLF